MTNGPAYTVETAVPTVEELAAAVLTALAEVRCVTVTELEAELEATGGDLEMDSLEAVAVIAKLESEYEDASWPRSGTWSPSRSHRSGRSPMSFIAAGPPVHPPVRRAVT